MVSFRGRSQGFVAGSLRQTAFGKKGKIFASLTKATQAVYRLSTMNEIEKRSTRGAVSNPASCQPVTNKSTDQELARLAWAIAHPARVRLLRILIARAARVCGELVGQMNLAQSTVSQHLKVLKDAGLIQGEIDGPKVCYCINPNGLRRLKELVTGL
jgi:ArsR family transcriptional regulator